MLRYLGLGSGRTTRKRSREETEVATPDVHEQTKRVLLEQLQCPVCMSGLLLPPVRQCPNGHLLCDPCSKQPACAKCPTCRSSPTNIRCLALEKVAEASGLHAPCPHCGISLPFGSFSEHTASCRARPALWLKSSLSSVRGPATRSRARRTGQHEAPDLVLSPLRPIAFGRSSAHSQRRLGVHPLLPQARSMPCVEDMTTPVLGSNDACHAHCTSLGHARRLVFVSHLTNSPRSPLGTPDRRANPSF